MISCEYNVYYIIQISDISDSNLTIYHMCKQCHYVFKTGFRTMSCLS